MTLEEAAKRYSLSSDTLESYVSSGFIHQGKTEGDMIEYSEEDFACLGLIDTLLSAGFTPEEIKRYLALAGNGGTGEEQVRMLRKQRFSLLDDIHKKQQLLDNLDFMIWKKRGGKADGRVK